VKQTLLYLPVLHAGYEAFLDRHADSAEILLLGTGFAALFPSMTKEIRALPPHRAAEYLRHRSGTPPVRVVEPAELPAALVADVVVMPDEQIMRELAAAQGLGARASFDRTFLRWDRPWSQAQAPVDYSGSITRADLARRLLGAAHQAAALSSDWWRQVGAVAARDGRVIARAHNQHLPTEYAPYLNGDPRNDFQRGQRADLSTAIHAEAALVARAARDGLPLAGTDLYVTTFPCPACAKLVAEAGFRTCYFAGPYSVLDGESVLRAAGLELIWVDLVDLAGADPDPASARR